MPCDDQASRAPLASPARRAEPEESVIHWRHATVSAACSTVGAPADDFDGFARGELPDMGAHEYGPPIFTDGFESGDTTAWSSTMP